MLKIRERERERKNTENRDYRRERHSSGDDHMENLLEVLYNVGGNIKGRSDDDSVDRLSRRYTTFFLVLFAILVSTKHYVGEPISCWVPAQFTANHEEYTDKVCWVSNTYYLPFTTNQIPEEGRDQQRVGYYQWIPMILLTQAVLFYLPCALWRLMNRRSGIHLYTIIDTARGSHWGAGGESHDKTIRFIVNHLDAYLSARLPYRQGCWQRIKTALAKRCIFIFGKAYGNYLTCLYLCCKLLYIGNAIGQLFVLDLFLGTDYHMFGINIAIALAQGENWRSSVRFPRVTLCDFEVRTLGNVHKHTVQCVLPINLFNEKIFIFVWFWFIFVALVTVFSFLHWLGRSMNRFNQDRYVSKQLRALDKVTRETEARTQKFTREYLRQDGVFIMRMVSGNAGDIVAAEILAGLWDLYIRDQRLLVDNNVLPPPLLMS